MHFCCLARVVSLVGFLDLVALWYAAEFLRSTLLGVLVRAHFFTKKLVRRLRDVSQTLTRVRQLLPYAPRREDASVLRVTLLLLRRVKVLTHHATGRRLELAFVEARPVQKPGLQLLNLLLLVNLAVVVLYLV